MTHDMQATFPPLTDPEALRVADAVQLALIGRVCDGCRQDCPFICSRRQRFIFAALAGHPAAPAAPAEGA